MCHSAVPMTSTSGTCCAPTHCSTSAVTLSAYGAQKKEARMPQGSVYSKSWCPNTTCCELSLARRRSRAPNARRVTESPATATHCLPSIERASCCPMCPAAQGPRAAAVDHLQCRPPPEAALSHVAYAALWRGPLQGTGEGTGTRDRSAYASTQERPGKVGDGGSWTALRGPPQLGLEPPSAKMTTAAAVSRQESQSTSRAGGHQQGAARGGWYPPACSAAAAAPLPFPGMRCGRRGAQPRWDNDALEIACAGAQRGATTTRRGWPADGTPG
mmetsp:Transcript_46244/g.117064  ORF Transcript_46244/g.117064 Transcript_46244/m.117064 type:complete len:272 (-) Transcript_46244:319-1134(-)